MRRLIWNIRWAQTSEGTVSHAVVQMFDYLVSVHGVWSGYTLFAFNTEISKKKKKYKKNKQTKKNKKKKNKKKKNNNNKHTNK